MNVTCIEEEATFSYFIFQGAVTANGSTFDLGQILCWMHLLTQPSYLPEIGTSRLTYGPQMLKEGLFNIYGLSVNPKTIPMAQINNT